MRTKPSLASVVALLVALVAPSALSGQAVVREPLSEARGAALSEAASRHAAALVGADADSTTGVWVLLSADNRILGSGVVTPLPIAIGSDTYGQVVPPAKGRVVQEYGMLRLTAQTGHPAVRVAYAVLREES